MKAIDITGKVFGRLTAIRPTGTVYLDGKREWLFLCSCGRSLIAPGSRVKSGNTRSCGCLSSESIIERCRKDITGLTFGRLKVLRYDRTEKKVAFWLCQCTCGREVSVCGTDIRSGHTKSCGCLGLENRAKSSTVHGKSKSKTYAVWKTMRQRCNNPRNFDYKYYGGRGVTVCNRWDKFSNFLEDMGEAPPGLTLDRIDPSGNYEKNNCRWTTWEVQRKNRRNNK